MQQTMRIFLSAVMLAGLALGDRNIRGKSKARQAVAKMAAHLAGPTAALSDALFKQLLSEGMVLGSLSDLKEELRRRMVLEAMGLSDEDDNPTELMREFALRVPDEIILVPGIIDDPDLVHLGENENAESNATESRNVSESRKAAVKQAMKQLVDEMKTLEHQGLPRDGVMRAVESMSESSEMESKNGETVVRTKLCGKHGCTMTVQHCKDGKCDEPKEEKGEEKTAASDVHTSKDPKPGAKLDSSTKDVHAHVSAAEGRHVSKAHDAAHEHKASHDHKASHHHGH